MFPGPHGSAAMRRHLLCLAALCTLGAVGCSGGLRLPGMGGPANPQSEPLLAPKTAQAKDGPTTPEQDAVLRVLEELKTATKTGFDGLKLDAQPSTVTRMAQTVVAALEKAPMTGCPNEFQTAYQKHLKAWKGFATAVGRLPDGAYPAGEFMDSLHGLFKNDPNRGKVLGGDVVTAVKKVNTTYSELYTVAGGYGIVAEDR